VISRLESGQVEGAYKRDLLKGLSAAVGGDTRTALETFDGVLARSQVRADRVAAYVFGAETLRRGGQWPAALERYHAAIPRGPAFPPAHYGLGMAFRATGQLDRAQFQFQELLRLEPAHVEGLCELADLMMVKRQPRAAFDYARQAASFAPDYARPYLAAGNGLLALGRPTDAHQYYRAAVERGMTWTLVAYNEGNVLLLVGDRAAAKARFTEVVDAQGVPVSLRNAAQKILATL